MMYNVRVIQDRFDIAFIVNYTIESSNSEIKCVHQCLRWRAEFDSTRCYKTKEKVLQTMRVRARGLGRLKKPQKHEKV